MKKKSLLVGLVLATSVLALAGCDNTTKPNEPDNPGINEDDNAKEKYVTFKVKENGEWKNLTSPALITNGKVTVPEAPAMDYYTFRGWFLDEGFVNEFENKDLDKSVTVYAYYVADEVNIVINGESQGTRDLADVINGTYNPGKDLTFDGWYTNPECTVKYNSGDPAKTLYAQSVATITFNNGYEDVYATKIKPNTVLESPTTAKALDDNGDTIKDDDNNELTIEQNNIVKSYMSSEDIYYVDEEGNEIDFTKAITKNTTVKVLWKSPFLGYKISPNSDDLFCAGTYGEYKASDAKKVDVGSVPVISIPSKITVEDENGNKSIKNVKAAYIFDNAIFNSTILKKVIVQEGIGYIRGFSSGTGASSVESIELPSTLKIIQNCFNNLDLTPETVKIPEGVEAIYESFWSKSVFNYNNESFNFYTGKEYDFDIEIPDSVKSLSMVPLNLKFSDNSSFVNDGNMIYQNTEKGKVLVSYDIIENDTINVPDGINGIQVGTFVNKKFKTLVLPESFSFINYNLKLNDYKDIYVWIDSPYADIECYLYSTELQEGVFAYNARMIVSTLESMDYVVFNNLNISDDVYHAIGGDNGYATYYGTFTYADNEIYKDIKVVNISSTDSPNIKVNLTNELTDEKYSVTISRTNSDAITINEILSAVDAQYGTSFIELKNASHLSDESIEVSQFGKEYDLNSTITTNKYLDVICNLINYKGFTYDASGNEVIVTGFDKNTAVDLGNNTFGVIIPDEIEGKKVTKIADNAFKENDLVKIVKFGSNITYIGENAFLDCSVITKIDFNNAKVESIGAHALEGTSVSSLSFSLANLKNVGAYAFKIETLTEFIPVNGEEERNATTVKDGEFYFGSTMIMANYIYLSLLKRVSLITVDGNNIYDVELYSYIVKNSLTNSINLGNIDDTKNIIRFEVLEGSISYTTSSNYIYLNSVSKIHTNAFTDCTTASRKIYYSADGLNVVGKISTVADLVSALPNVFDSNWINDYDTVSSYKVRLI